MDLLTTKKTSTAASSSQEEKPALRLRSVRSKGGEKLKKFITPMLASIGEKPFDSNEWIFEVKWDGYRAVAEVNNDTPKLYSRNGLSFMQLYPRVATALLKIKEDVVLDGEIVVLNENNKP